MTSAFDPAAFLNATIDTQDEKRDPLPTMNPEDPNGLYTAIIGSVDAKGGEKDGKPWLQMVVPLRIQVPAALQAQIGRPEVTITDRAFIDLTESGAIDNGKGRNARRRMYREATGQNAPGQAWAPRMLEGRPVKVQIKHEMYNDAVQERVGNLFPA